MGLLGDVVGMGKKKAGMGGSGGGEHNPPVGASGSGVVSKFANKLPSLKKTGKNGVSTASDSSAAMTE